MNMLERVLSFVVVSSSSYMWKCGDGITYPFGLECL